MVQSTGSHRTFNPLLPDLDDEGGDVIFATAFPAASKTARPALPKRPTLSATLDDDDDEEEVIFAESWPAPVTPLPQPTRPMSRAASVARASKRPAANEIAPPAPRDETQIFATADVSFAAGAAPAPTPAPASRVLDVDQLWQDFDLEVEQGLAAGHCPNCDDLLRLDAQKATVTCRMCGSTYASFHAYVRQGNA